MSVLGPSIVLVGTTLPENLGAAARGMANFGLSDLRLVQPACNPLDPKAIAASTHGEGVLRAARVFDTLADALADRTDVWATTALQRTFRKPTQDPREAAPQWGPASAIVFGPERTGLSYADLTWSHALLTFPTEPEARALNLGTAVSLVAWEWKAAGSGDLQGADGEPPAPMMEQIRLLDELEARLDAVGWASEPGLKVRTLRSLRTVVLRARLVSSEVTLLRGVFKALGR